MAAAEAKPTLLDLPALLQLLRLAGACFCCHNLSLAACGFHNFLMSCSHGLEAALLPAAAMPAPAPQRAAAQLGRLRTARKRVPAKLSNDVRSSECFARTGSAVPLFLRTPLRCLTCVVAG